MQGKLEGEGMDDARARRSTRCALLCQAAGLVIGFILLNSLGVAGFFAGELAAAVLVGAMCAHAWQVAPEAAFLVRSSAIATVLGGLFSIQSLSSATGAGSLGWLLLFAALFAVTAAGLTAGMQLARVAARAASLRAPSS